MTGMPLVEIGVYLAETLKTCIVAAIADQQLQQPAEAMVTPGTGIPVHDCCDGLLWVRLDTMWPTLGDGNPMPQARPDFSLPAWNIRLHAGILWCHPTIDEEGYAVDPEKEAEIAHRDSQYRLAVYAALSDRDAFPTAAQPAALGYKLAPWLPFGPEGGCSGGQIYVDVIVDRLCLIVD